MKKFVALAAIGLVLVCMLSLTWYETQVVSSYGYLLRKMQASAEWGLALGIGGAIACATIGTATGGLGCAVTIAF